MAPDTGLEKLLANLDNTNLIFGKDFASFIKKNPIYKKMINLDLLEEGMLLVNSIRVPADSTDFYIIGYVKYGSIYDLASHCYSLTIKSEVQEAALNHLQIGNLYELVLDSFDTNKTLADNLLAFRIFKVIRENKQAVCVDACMFIRLNGMDSQNYSDATLWVEVSKYAKSTYRNNKKERGANFIFMDNIYNQESSAKIDNFVREIDNNLPSLNSINIVYTTLFAYIIQNNLNFGK